MRSQVRTLPGELSLFSFPSAALGASRPEEGLSAVNVHLCAGNVVCLLGQQVVIEVRHLQGFCSLFTSQGYGPCTALVSSSAAGQFGCEDSPSGYSDGSRIPSAFLLLAPNAVSM